MTVEAYIQEKTGITLLADFIDTEIEELRVKIDLDHTTLACKVKLVFAYFLTLPMVESIAPAQHVKTLSFSQPKARMWSSEHGIAQNSVPDVADRETKRPSLLWGIFSRSFAENAGNSLYSGGRASLEPFVCEVVYHTYRDILIESDYSVACPLVRTDEATEFKLLLGYSGDKTPKLSDTNSNGGKINSRFLLPGSKILVSVSMFRDSFIEATEFRLLGGYAVSLINACLKSHNENLKALHVQMLNQKVQEMLEEGANFEDIRLTWDRPRLMLNFTHCDFDALFA